MPFLCAPVYIQFVLKNMSATSHPGGEDGTEPGRVRPAATQDGPSPGPSRLVSCPPERYRELMLTQMEVYKRHIVWHVRFHPEIPQGGDILAHFFGMFGDFFRRIFCTFACQDRFICDVRRQAPFMIDHAYRFEQLLDFPRDVAADSTIQGCAYGLQRAAVESHIARHPKHIERHKYFYGICGVNEMERARRHFLAMYGPLLRDMFCSAVCPGRGRCRRLGDSYSPVRTA